MRIKTTLASFFILFSFFFGAKAQIFWTEDFTSPCASLCQLPFTSPNGTWTWVSTGTNGAAANTWFVSLAEGGFGRGVCGAPGTGTEASLHVGNVSNSPAAFIFCPTGDCGAACDYSPCCPDVTANARATSPIINCTGKTNITLSFNYLEKGLPGVDFASVWYYNGAVWAALVTPPTTALCGSQGKWTYYSVALPASANNNANVQIGFNWQNTAGNSGADPSFAVDSVSLSVPIANPPVADFICDDSTVCACDSVHFKDLSSGPPTIWQWTFTGGSPATSPAKNPVVYYCTPGNYTVKEVVKNVNGKDSLTKVNYIHVLAPPTVTISPPATICADSTINLSATGGGTYSWSTGATTSSINVTPNATTNYTLQVVGVNGCKKDTSVLVTVNPRPTVTLSGNTNLCPGDSTILTATGGGTYAWSTGATTSSIKVFPAATITYSVDVTNGGCKKDTTITVTVATRPTAHINHDTTVCAGAVLTLTASGGTSYNWSTGATTSQITVTMTTTKTYTVAVSNGGCPADTNVKITVNPTPTVTITGTPVICAGQKDTLKATGGGTYAWSTGATTSSIIVTPATNTTFTLGVSNGTCTKDTSFSVTVNPSPTVTISGDTSICVGDSTTLTATGGGSYLWSNGATTNIIKIKPGTDSTLTVTVTLSGCSTASSKRVIVSPKPVPTVGPTRTTCQGAPVDLSASGGTTYTWSPAAGLNSTTVANPIATPTATTEYTVVVANGGCTAIDSEQVVVNPVIPITASASPPIITSGSSSTLDVTPLGSILWTPSSTLSCSTCQQPAASPTVTTWYYVFVTEPDGCIEKDSVLVTVKEKCGNVFVPTAFSPNSSTVANQKLTVMCNPACVTGFDFKIYDRWGNIVFETNDPSNGWDGSYNGKPMNSATYVYYLNYLDVSNNMNGVSLKGNITLVR
jgi:gliding motility-associated-like protein